MKKNMGNADRLIRVLAATIMAILYLSHTVTGVAGVLLLVLAGVFLLTSLFGFCPLYLPFGFSTCRKKV